MPTAEIITIGTEILLGEIVDTNSRHIARALRDIGVDLYWKTTVGDNLNRIVQAIHLGLTRSDIIITTGGLGPTVDDPTREAIARAVGVPSEFHPELWVQIQERFQRYGRRPTENNKRQAYIPQGAIAVENPVGTAPAFIVETGTTVIISIPGVPREMEHLLEFAVIPYLRQRYTLTGLIKARVLHTAGVGESQIDELIADLEELANPTVGLAAHAGQVDIRLTAKAASLAEAETMLAPLEQVIRQRLGERIYGVDEETLEDVALAAVARRGWNVGVLEAGLNGGLTQRLASAQGPFAGGEVLQNLPDQSELTRLTRAFRDQRRVDVALGVALIPGPEQQNIYLILITPEAERNLTRSFGGPPLLAPTWAANASLDLLRKLQP